MMDLDKLIESNCKRFYKGYNTLKDTVEEDVNIYDYVHRKLLSKDKSKPEKEKYYIVNDEEIYTNLYQIRDAYGYTLTKIKNRINASNLIKDDGILYYNLGRMKKKVIPQKKVNHRKEIKVNCQGSTYIIKETELRNLQAHPCSVAKVKEAIKWQQTCKSKEEHRQKRKNKVGRPYNKRKKKKLICFTI